MYREALNRSYHAGPHRPGVLYPPLALGQVATPVLLVVCALAVWWRSLQSVDVRRINDLGLVSALPPSTFVALAVLALSFSLLLAQRRFGLGLVLLHVVALVVMLYGSTTLVEDVPRFQATWKHFGVSEYILRHGSVDPGIDAYFNWPGFFLLSAFLTDVAGLGSLVGLADWLPVVFSLLYLGPLLLILRAFSSDERLVWLGVWVFYLGNWVGQDYYAPQTLNFLFYLVLLGVLLNFFRVTPHRPDLRHTQPRSQRSFVRFTRQLRAFEEVQQLPYGPASGAQRVGWMVFIVVLCAAMVASHQLTPFFALAAITGLVLFNRVSFRWLPLLLGAMVVLWLSTAAATYLQGHASSLVSDPSRVNSTVGANVNERLKGSAEHVFIVRLRMGFTVALWGLALLGGLRRLQRGHLDLAPALLLLAPFPFFVIQPYGGEMLLRVYMFALPFVAYFVAALFYPHRDTTPSWREPVTAGVVGVMSLALVGAFFLARFGNERMDYFTHEEIEALEFLYDTAPPGSLLLSGSHNLPWRYRDYADYRYVTTPSEVVAESDVGAVRAALAAYPPGEAFMVLTRSQAAHIDLFSGLPEGALGRLEDALRAAQGIRLLYANEDATLLTLTPETAHD